MRAFPLLVLVSLVLVAAPSFAAEPDTTNAAPPVKKRARLAAPT